MRKLSILLIFLLFLTYQNNARAITETKTQTKEADICIYGATPSGITAAIAAKREGKSVVIIEPSKWVGGILGSGLKPRQDCPNIEAVGGMTRPLIESLGVRNGKTAHRDINPKDIRADFLALIEKHDIEIIYDHRISSCVKEGVRIIEAIFELAPFSEEGVPVQLAKQHHSLTVKAKVFIDASYEGELMAHSNVSFRVGRESKLTYGEENAGNQPPANLTPIDPFKVPGQPESGLLPLVDYDHGKPIGSDDHYTQAYNFRFYLTSDASYRVPIEPPGDYDPQTFELVGRYVKHLTETTADSLQEKELSMIFPGWMNAGEYNYQRNSLITMAPVGISHLYANGSYAEKALIWKNHRDYLRGLYHFMKTDKRVPEFYRRKMENLGMDIRPHPDTNGWPHQLYIRVSRRLMGPYTVTAHDVYNRTAIDDPIGLAQYGIDTYPTRRIVVVEKGKNFVGLEGKMFVGGAQGPTNVPYPISFRAITPMANECENLLVPVCFSASHLGYASARMEPVFMICGESAGIAAAQSINENVSVQQINMPTYQKKLLDYGQRLEW